MVEPGQLSGRGSKWSRLWLALSGHRAAMAVLAVSSLLAGIAESGILAVLAQSAAMLVEGSSRLALDIGPLSVSTSLSDLLVAGFALALLRIALQLPLSIVPARVVVDLQISLGTDLFGAFARAPWALQSRDREGHLQAIVSEQVAQASTCALLASSLATALLSFVVMIISALLLNAAAAALVLIAAVAIFALLRPLSALGQRRAQASSDASLEYLGGVGEAIRLAEETHAFGVVEIQHGRIAALAREVRGPFFHSQLLANLTPGIYQGLIYLLILTGLAILNQAGVGEVTLVGTVVLILVRAGSYGQQAQSAYQGLRQCLPYLERVQETRHRYATAVQEYGSERLDAVRALAFEGVGFAYEPDRPVLSGIDFEVGAGEAIGIVGPSGAGKSTLVQILLGLRAPDSGRYLVNGAAAEQFARDDWHRLFAYVPQRPRLLHASVAENIRFMRDLDDEAVRRAARLAGIHDDVVTWPRGYDTVVGPRADAVSGGQEQRICLARALAARPQVLILDEPTASLDSHGEKLIQESLAGLRGELTLFVVAHRMSMLEICQRAMVVVDGRLEAFDTIERLPEISSYYRSASLIGQAP